MPSEPTTRGIGARLRAARRQRGLTLEALGSSTGLSKGFISNVERDATSPSVASLLALCDALRIPVGSLFDHDDARLVRAREAPRIFFGGRNVEDFVLTPRSERRVQVMRTVIEPGGTDGNEPYSLPIDVEFAYVLEGTLELHVDTDVYQLAKGDAITFAGGALHSWCNPSKEDTAEVLWLLAPALE